MLGATAAAVDGEDVPLGGPIPTTIMAVLAVAAPDVVSTERLIDVIWDDGAPPAARKTLQAHVAKLRRSLAAASAGDDVIVGERGRGYRLAPFVQTDIGRLRTLTHAAKSGDAWTGRSGVWSEMPLGGCVGTISVESLRTTLDEERARALLAWAERSAVTGELGPDPALLEARLVVHPYDEALWAALVTTLADAGRRRDALEVYQRARTTMIEGIGLDPGPLLQAAEARALSPVAAADPISLGAVPAQRAGMPLAPGTFVGRQDDLDVLPALLDESPFVTLVGPGGAGKTRLAVEVARRHGGPVVFVDLTRIEAADESVDGIVQVVAEAAGLGVFPEGRATAALAFALARRPVLLVLDNCEHVLKGIAILVSSLAGTAGETRVLATSRAPLGTAAERVHRLRPLTEGQEGEAVRLFLARSGNAGGLAGEAADVAELCARIDRLPLAIEFVAARSAHLSPAEMLARLDDRMMLLSHRSSVHDRHRTMATVLSWSHDLLGLDAQLLLRRLAVFRGWFDLRSVESVCTDVRLAVDEVVDALAELIDHSLVVAHATEVRSRYRLLETVRSFATTVLDASEEAASVRRRHATHRLERLESFPWDASFFDTAATAELTSSIDDIGLAMYWAEQHGDHELLARLAGRCHLIWSPSFGRGAEGRRWLDQVLDHEADLDDETRTAALTARAFASLTLGLQDQEDLVERAIAVGHELGGFLNAARGLHAFGAATRAAALSDETLFELARARLQALFRSAAGHPTADWTIHAHCYAGYIESLAGDIEAADAAYSKALDSGPLRWTNRRAIGPDLLTVRYLLGDHRGALDALPLVTFDPPPGVQPALTPCAQALNEAALGMTAESAVSFQVALDSADRDLFLGHNHAMIYAAAIMLERDEPIPAAELLAASLAFGHASATDLPFRTPASYVLFLHVQKRLLSELEGDRRRVAWSRGLSMDDEAALDLLDTIAN